jgi:hypothetical protein
LGAAPVTQEEIERFLARQVAFDPDIWILDIDDPAGTALLDEPTEDRPGDAGGAAFWPFSNR